VSPILNQLVDFREIQQVRHAIEDDLDDIIFHPVASTVQEMADIQSSETMQNLNVRA
jgi:hypothetical protein